MAVAVYERYPVPPGAIEHPWRRDIVTGVASMTTTGGHLWNAAERLADYMEAEACLIGLDRVGVDVLELGAGVGWLGMCLAANLRQAHTITCTEQASGGAIDWLRQNVDKNSHLDLSRLRCCVCDWTWFDSNHTSHKPGQDTDPSSANISGSSVRIWESGACISPVPASSGLLSEDYHMWSAGCQKWDFIVGSDLVYNEEGCRLLPRVLAQLAQPGTVILYAHTKRRFEMLDADFFCNLQKEGLAVEEVKERWAPEAPSSPPPFESVFPDMRIAVFRIAKCNNVVT